MTPSWLTCEILGVQLKGHRVCIVERRAVEGRNQVRCLLPCGLATYTREEYELYEMLVVDMVMEELRMKFCFIEGFQALITGVCALTQEWNISRGELDVLSALGLLSAQEVERSVVSAWNPVTGCHQAAELCRNCLQRVAAIDC